MKYHALLLLAVLISAFALSQSTPPTVAVSSPTISLGGEENPAPARYEENRRPLSGVQNFDLGTRTDLMNTLTPAFTFSETYGTNPGLANGSNAKTVWGSTTNIGGSARLLRGDAKQLFSMSYEGSAQLSSYNSNLNTQIHSLDVTESFTAGRWSYLIGDILTYQPYANAALRPLLFPGSNAGAVGPDFRGELTASPSILTPQNTQLSNSVLGQVTYGLSRSSMLTGSASYGILHYLDGDLLDTRQFSGTGGFDHMFGRNTLGLSYTYSKFMFENFAEDLQTNTIQMTYGRRIIGRVSFAAGIGPTFRTTTLGQLSSTEADVTGLASLRYATGKGSLLLAYSRAITGGSGITAGALTDSVSASADRVLTRTLTGNMSVGYSRNSADQSAAVFNTVYVATGLSHSVGRYMSMSVGYRGQKQTSDSAIGNLSTHSVVASIMWHFQPIRLK